MNTLVPLEFLAKEINACHDKAAGYDKKAEEFRIARDKHIVEAHDRITAKKELDISFEQWCNDNLDISYRGAKKVVQKLTGPKAIVQSERGVLVPTNSTVQLDQPFHEPVDLSTVVLPKPVDPIKEAYAHVESTLTEDQFIELTKQMVKRCNEIAAERKQRAPAWRADIDIAIARPGTEEFQIERSAFYLARKKQQEEQGF